MVISTKTLLPVLMFCVLFYGVQLNFTHFAHSVATSDLVQTSFGHFINAPKSADTQKSIFLVGDVLLARDVERKLLEHGTDYPFEAIAKHLNGAQLIGNFEASIPEIHVPTPDLNTRFSVSTSSLSSLQSAGFTHLSLANNHALDFGQHAFTNTQHQLQEIGVTAFGKPDEVTAISISYLDVEGIAVALLGINAVSGYPDKQVVQSVLEKASNGSSQQIIFIHWGEEYSLVANNSQREFAHFLVEAGADVIVGHHPHVVQDIETYQNVPIFYSLGNFVFDQYFSDAVQEGLMLQLQFEEKSLQITLHPVTSKQTRAQPHFMTEENSRNFLQALAVRSSKELQTAIQSGDLAITYANKEITKK